MVYKWYILPIGGLYIIYHLLREPETAIDERQETTPKHQDLWKPKKHPTSSLSISVYMVPEPLHINADCPFQWLLVTSKRLGIKLSKFGHGWVFTW